MGRLAGRAVPARLGGLPSRVKPPPKLVEDIYRSKPWRQLVARIKAERGAWCERCGGTHRLIGDHINELKDGGAALDEANVQLLCQACHNAKTAKAKAARARG